MRTGALVGGMVSCGRLLALSAAGLGVLAAAPAARADLLDHIQESGELTVATEARFPPFEFVENGQIVGYSQDVMDLIMAELPDVELVRLDLPWQGILPGLAAERFDYVVTSVTATKERYDNYHLSLPIADATMAVLKRKGDESITEPEDLAGKTVGTQTGSAQLQATERLAGRLEDAGTPIGDIRTYVDFNEAYADLGTGRVDAVVNSLPNLLEAARQRPDVFEVVTPTFGPQTYFVWAGRKDDESASLNAFIDEQLRELNESGELAELQEKWFETTMDLPTELPVPEQ